MSIFSITAGLQFYVSICDTEMGYRMSHSSVVLLFCFYASVTVSAEAFCFRVVRPSVRPAVRLPFRPSAFVRRDISRTSGRIFFLNPTRSS